MTKPIAKQLLGLTLLLALCLALRHNGLQLPAGRAAANSAGPSQDAGSSGADPVYTDPVPAGLSPALRDLPVVAPGELANVPAPRLRPAPVFDPAALPAPAPDWRDPAVPAAAANPLSTPALLIDFAGMDRSISEVSPPDTIGAAGQNYFVEAVNSTFITVYNKSDGGIAAGPYALHDLWTGNDGCEVTFSGDPVVTYDWLAGRWLLAQLGGGNGICVAVSVSGDPLGSYHTYRFDFGTFPDYFKIGTWSDAYYVGAIQSGQNVHALDRDQMLAGQPAGVISFAQANVGQHFILLPASHEGDIPPPAGAPGLFYRFIDGDLFGGVDRLQLFEFYVDFTTPANSTWTGPFDLPSQPFASLCNFDRNCIRQPDTTQRLDSITELPMWRLAYRNFGARQTLVGNHAVDVGGDQAGVRWFELRRNGSGPWTIYQESTHAPDSDSRWMASIAMDSSGNIALGYNVSSTTVYPGLRYAGRLITDTLNTLATEASLIEGSGAQTVIFSWGDYAALTVDPADDCTFWFTGEHFQAPSGASWSTHIGAFKFPSCGVNAGTTDLALTKTVAIGEVTIGEPITYSLTITNLGGATADNVLVTDLLPAGVSFVSAAPSSGSCAHVNGTVNCNLGSLADQAVVTIDIVALAVEVGVQVNQAAVNASQLDPDGDNNYASASVTVDNSYYYLPTILKE